MLGIATAKLSIPADLMAYWQEWREGHGLCHQVSHAALYAFTILPDVQRWQAITLTNLRWRQRDRREDGVLFYLDEDNRHVNVGPSVHRFRFPD